MDSSNLTNEIVSNMSLTCHKGVFWDLVISGAQKSEFFRLNIRKDTVLMTYLSISGRWRSCTETYLWISKVKYSSFSLLETTWHRKWASPWL